MDEPIDLVINHATVSDIFGILCVQEENLLANKNKVDFVDKEFLSAQGFLIHAFTHNDLEKIIKDKENHILLVAKNTIEIVGYFLGYYIIEWYTYKPNWIDTALIDSELKSTIEENKVLYGRHVARKPSWRGKQIGRKLEHAAFQEAKVQGYESIIVEILEQPIANEVSIKVHTSLGYEKIGSISEEDKLEWGIWKKEL